MAELDPSIIFRQEKYSGPTQDELDAKQDMNALRNMLGAGRSIDSPDVINAMMARNPDLGLKLQSNASTLQTNAAAAQKSIADAQAKDGSASEGTGRAVARWVCHRATRGPAGVGRVSLVPRAEVP